MKKQQDIRDMYPPKIINNIKERTERAKRVRKAMRELLKEDKRYYQIMQNLYDGSMPAISCPLVKPTWKEVK